MEVHNINDSALTKTEQTLTIIMIVTDTIVTFNYAIIIVCIRYDSSRQIA